MTAALSAAHRARKFLLASQQPLGWWSDFRLAPGASTLWVTAYVGAALARSGGRDAAMRAWRFLRRWVAGGWGYSQATPPDADSTAWCLGLAAMLEWRQDPLVEDARRFLTSCTRSDGGLATYPCNDDIRCFVGAGAADSFAGWVAAAKKRFREKGPQRAATPPARQAAATPAAAAPRAA